jgi:hypothetical protein
MQSGGFSRIHLHAGQRRNELVWDAARKSKGSSPRILLLSKVPEIVDAKVGQKQVMAK